MAETKAIENRGSFKYMDKTNAHNKGTISITLGFESTCVFLTFFGLGLSSAVLGPTLVHLEILFNTTTQGMSVALVGLNIGILAGSALCSLIFDRLNRKLSFSMANLVIGLSLILAPRSPHVYGFHACIILMAVGHGFLVSGGSPYIMTLWRGHRFQAPMVQAVHATWALGAFICPFLAIPFLAELPQNQDEAKGNTTNDVTAIASFNTSDSNDSAYGNDTADPGKAETRGGIERVRYVYLTVGLIVLCVSMFCAVVLFMSKPSLKYVKSFSDSGEETNVTARAKEKGMVWKIAILVLVFIFCVCYFWYDFIPGTFMSAFVIKGLHWPVERGALMTSLYYGCAGLGKVIGVPVSYVLSPTKMLFLGTGLALTAYVVMAMSAIYYAHLIWVASALAGFSIATAFPTIILWTGSHMTITGALGGMFLIAASCGGIVGSALGGFLFDKTPLSIPYLAISACLMNIGLFIAANMVAKLYRKEAKIGSGECFESSDKDLKEERDCSSKQPLTLQENIV